MLEKLRKYNTRTELKKEKTNMNEVYNFLKECGTYYLATVEGDQPRVITF